MKILKFFKKKKRTTLVVDQTYDSPAYKVPQEMQFACPETGWTTSSYSSRRFKKYMDGQFEVEARKAAQNIDADVPWYMDKRIISVVSDAIHDLEELRATRSESIDEIINKKKNTADELSRELADIKAEKERLQKIIDEIGGYDNA